MDRRTLLRRAAAIGAIGLAGCTGNGSPTDGPGGTPDGTPTPSPAPPTTEPPETVEIDTFDFTVTDATGDAEPTANAEFDTEANEIRFTGIIQGKNLCQTAALESIDYDRQADEVHLAVKTKKRADADDACGQQQVFISYEATVSFTGGLPSQVSVSHDGEGVMSGAHDSAAATPPS
jgi:hypothetical protein